MQAKTLTPEEWAVCSSLLSAGIGRAIPANQLQVYYDLLTDIPLATLKGACMRALQEQKDNWLPSVGLIRSLASEVGNGLLPNWADEWDHVRMLVRSCGYMRKGDAMRAMSPVTQQAVKGVGWESICDSENIAIQAAQFRMAYEAAAKREQDMRRISPELRPAIEYGPSTTPAVDRGLIGDAIKRLADGMTPPDEGKP